MDFRDSVESEVVEEREALGLPEDPVEELIQAKTAELGPGHGEEEVIEEIVEEVIEESEEIVSQ